MAVRRDRILRWEVEFDMESTQEAYRALESGGADRCRCPSCRNFAVARDRVYPPTALAIFERLGIDPRKEREVYLMVPEKERSTLLCGGWFHFHGAILSGRDGLAQLPGGRGYPSDFEPLTKSFSLGLTSHAVLVPQPFAGRPVVQVEFAAQVPWVLTEPMPP